jgi:hypothetical protein
MVGEVLTQMLTPRQLKNKSQKDFKVKYLYRPKWSCNNMTHVSDVVKKQNQDAQDKLAKTKETKKAALETFRAEADKKRRP